MTTIRLIRARLVPCLIAACFAGLLALCPGASMAQQAPQDQPAAPAPATLAELGQRLDGVRSELSNIEASLQSPNLTDGELQQLRTRIDPASERVGAIVNAAAPRIEAAKARLDQLGPKPAAGATESPDIAADRAAREKALAEVEDIQKRAKALQVEADQTTQVIADRRRVSFTRTLMQRDLSLVTPDLWVALAAQLPRDLETGRAMAQDWAVRALDRVRDGRIWFLLIGVLAAGVLIAIKRRLQPGFAARDVEIARPAPLQVALVAGARALLGSVPIVLACIILYVALDAIYLMPMRTGPIFLSVFIGIGFVAVARALGDAVLAPDKTQWRLARIDDPTAQQIMRFVWTGSGLVALRGVADAMVQAIASADPLNIVVRGGFSIAFALLLANTLRGLKIQADAADDACLGPYVPPPQSRWAAPLRILGWLACAAIIVAVIFGYVTLSAFIVTQIVWLAMLAAVIILCLAVTDELFGAAVHENTRVSLALQSSIGLRRRSLQQFAVLTSGAARVILIVIAVLLALAPLGVESSDLFGSLRGAFFGFKIGDYTVSLSAVLAAAFLFTLGVIITRAVQRWLDRSLLPATDLDAGLRNSIQTIFGYLGIIVAASIAFVQLGLSFDKLTIVAGALSVGIGFGLQSIVSNFVSGLILLGERPIRVGDQIVVGSDEGIVKRINVRATEIETFDKAVVIVPNSGLVTGVVRNKVRNNRMGRVLLTIGMPRVSDPIEVRRILTEVASGHPDVLETPGPLVFFKKLDREFLEFDLICFVSDLSTTGRVGSDINFEIYRRLQVVGLAGATPEPPPAASEPPPPAPFMSGEKDKD